MHEERQTDVQYKAVYNPPPGGLYELLFSISYTYFVLDGQRDIDRETQRQRRRETVRQETDRQNEGLTV